MGAINYNDAAFRALFPAYSNTGTYPQSTLQGYWNSAILYISNRTGGCYFGGSSVAQQTQAINLMTAHLTFLAGIIAGGQVPGLVQTATIDKVTVGLTPPPLKNQWQQWLCMTPYGQQLFSLLQIVGVGGVFVPAGVPGRAGFRFSGVR